MLKNLTQQVIESRNAVNLLKEEQSLYTQWPSVGVVIPVRNSERTIRQCTESVLNQDYAGPLTIWIVGNPEDQDNTWDALGDLAKDPRVHCIKLPRPQDWYGRDAMLKRLRGCEAAYEAGAEMLTLLDSQVFAPPDWLSKAVKLIKEHHVDGAAGISCKHPQDRSLSGIYQEKSLISEWPRYGPGFLLSRDTFGVAPGLPITANLVVSRRLYEQARCVWPMEHKYDWDDFLLAWKIVSSGFKFICSDELLVYRNHKRKFRFIKHFSAGVGAFQFYKGNPECEYVKRRMRKALLAVMLLVIAMFTLVISLFIGGLTGLLGFFLAIIIAMVPWSTASAIKSRDWRGVFFPTLDVVHTSIWIMGVTYLLIRRNRDDPEAANLLVQFR